MPEYRLYILNEHGHAASGADVVCNSDDHAIRTFERHEHLYGAELWRQGRLVRAFDASVRQMPTAENGRTSALRMGALEIAAD